MEIPLALVRVWSGLLLWSLCQAQRSSMTNPLQQLAGDIKFCGQTLMHINAANRPGLSAPGLPPRQAPGQVFQSPTLYGRRQPPPANPMGQAVFGFQASRPYMNRVKRQIQGQQANYQPAFVPDIPRNPQDPHAYRPQQAYQQQPQQAYLQQQQMPPGLYPQQRFLAPQQAPTGQHAGIQNLLMALDPPDPPDMPDFYIRTTPSPWSPPARAMPQPGPQLNKPAAANVNLPGPQMFQRPGPPPSPPQTHFFSPPVNPPAPGGAMSPLQIRNLANMPMLRGIDTICFCTDTATCVLVEGNLEYTFVNQCSAAPPPSMPPPRTPDVCCCMG